MGGNPCGAALPAGTWKHRLGVALLVYSFIPICTVELIAFLPLGAAQAVTVGAVYIASGEIACLAAIALLGKPFIEGVKGKIKAFFLRGWQPTSPRPISRLRHTIGIVLFIGSLLPYYITLGVLLFTLPGAAAVRGLLYLLLAGEGLFFLSLAVLGGEFWARLKKLFEWPGQEPLETDGHPASAGSVRHG